MELGYRGVTGCQHLRIDLPRDHLERLGIDVSRKLVHTAAPGPEAIPAGWRTALGMPDQHSLERVAMGVGETGNNERRYVIAFTLPRGRLDGADEPVAHFKPNVVSPAGC